MGKIVEPIVTEDTPATERVLKKSDFPKTEIGELDHCDYMIGVWTRRKGVVTMKYRLLHDRLMKAEERADRLKRKLAGE